MGVGICPHREDYDTIEDRQVTHDLENGRLLRAYNVCCAAEFRALARSRHHGCCFTALDESPGIRGETCTGFNEHGFPSEHRLIEFDRATGQMHIGSDYSTKRELYQVAAYQFRCRYGFPRAITLN